MSLYGEVEVHLYTFLTMALGGAWSVSKPGHFTPAETIRSINFIGWVAPEPEWMPWRTEKSLSLLGI